MVVLCGIPGRRAFDGRDRHCAVFGIPAADRGFGGTAVQIVGQEDRAAILCADVVALAVQLCRIMRAHEHIKDVSQRDHCRIEGHPDRFGMAGGAAAHLLVIGVLGRAADIAAFDIGNAHNIAEHRLCAPETSACDNGLLQSTHRVLLCHHR